MEEDRLVRAWWEGDEEAGAKLVERHFWEVSAFMRTKAGNYADELTQDTFLACLEARARFDPSRSFRAYLFGIARIKILEHLKLQYKQGNRFDSAHLSVCDVCGDGPGIVTQREEQRVVLRALRTLPIDAQMTIELFYWTGLSVSEIASILGVAPGTVKSRLARARQLLRVALEKAGPVSDAVRSRLGEWEAWGRDLVSPPPKGS